MGGFEHESKAFANRLGKRWRHLRKWAARQGTTAFRVYDRDLPDHPFTVERYGDWVQVSELPPRAERREESAAFAARRAAVLAATSEVLEVPPERIVLKRREPHAWGKSQYERLGREGERLVVEEGGLRFGVELRGQLDSGLFLDHRTTRARVREEASGKRFLNLFGYTGSFTVHAAAGGASATTTVDLSQRYLSWAEDNLRLNGLAGPRHRFVCADVIRWLGEADRRKERFELAVLDPPSRSSSAKMRGSLDVQRDHPALIASTLALLEPGGVLYFSTNLRTFKLRREALPPIELRELTPGSLPEDFRQKNIHRCFRMVLPPSPS